MKHAETTTMQASYHGIWMARSVPLAYRALPKCGCSSIGQLLHFIDHGEFYEGSVHDADAPIPKWGANDWAEEAIRDQFAAHPVFSFTLGRNPYRRLLSSFADKIFGYQVNGRRYRGGEIHRHMHEYGLAFGPKSNIVENFKRFVRFAADTIEKNTPIPADLHWNTQTAHLRWTYDRNPNWSLNFVGHIESFTRDLATVVDMAEIPRSNVPDRLPRENSTSLPNIQMSTWFGADEIAIVTRVYSEDFDLFHYGRDPEAPKPERGIDAAHVNRILKSEMV